jgi:hypothetical protein
MKLQALAYSKGNRILIYISQTYKPTHKTTTTTKYSTKIASVGASLPPF